jgi:CRP/FNR family transcriptional regulator, cyclic AMP receptor protein
MISPELLRRYPFFAGLDANELAGIAMIAEEAAFPDGAMIFREGEAANTFYVLTQGVVELILEVQRPKGTDALYVGSVATGEPFGLSAVLGKHSFKATARAREPIRAICIDAVSLAAMADANCHLGYTLMRQVAQALDERLGAAHVQLAACN